MVATKKVLTVFPQDLLQKLDGVSKEIGITRSELIRQAVTYFLNLQKELAMINGYEAMGKINLEIAENGLILDNQQLNYYEQLLIK